MRRARTAPVAAFVFFSIAATLQTSVGGFGEKAYQYIQYLDAKGPRAAGLPGERNAADYISSELAFMGYAPQRQNFSETFQRLNKRITFTSQNISCLKVGSSTKEIVIAAHYDGATNGNGTDDNASGVALLLEMCQRVRELSPPSTVRFVFFGAEELGEVGSKFYVRTLDKQSRDRIAVMLNFDSLIAGDKLYVHGSAGDRGVVREWFLKKAGELGIPLCRQSGRNARYPAGTAGDWGDHVPFDKAQIQYAAFEATNWDLGDLDGNTQTDMRVGQRGMIWHTRYDTLEYIDSTFPGRSGDHLAAFATLLYDFLEEYR